MYDSGVTHKIKGVIMHYAEIDHSAGWQSNDSTPQILYERDVDELSITYLEIMVVACRADAKMRVWHQSFAFRRTGIDVAQVGQVNDVVNTAQMSDLPAMNNTAINRVFNGTKFKLEVVGDPSQDTFFSIRVRGLVITEI